MNIVYFLIPLALLLGGVFAVSFIIAVVKGQYDDLETPAYKILINDEPKTKMAPDLISRKDSLRGN
ncbi:MAG: cbb3-type cytochrome oxidase assembly protein CcoS [Bdellovibrionota bacterium]